MLRENFRPNLDKPTPTMFSSYNNYLKYLESIEREYIKEDTLELKELEKRLEKEDCSMEIKETALELIKDIHNYAVDYVAIIGKQGGVNNENNGKEFREKIKTIDESRQRKHDALIDSINIANRYILKNFKKFKSSPIKVDTNNRDMVKDWAIRLVEKTTKIEKSSI